MDDRTRIDFHMHSTVSDGTDTPPELLERVRESGIRIFAVTDHDAVEGVKILRGILAGDDPKLISGVEFSCREEDEKYHILGYGFDPDAEEIRKVVEKGHALRMRKLRKRLDLLDTMYHIRFSQEDTDRLFAMNNPGKPHIGNLMIKYGIVKTLSEAMSKYLNHLHSKDEYIHPEEAVRSILEAGGIPVLAHPSYGSGNELILGKDMDARLRYLMDFGLQGVEALYSAFTPRLRDEMLRFAVRYGLYVTAGSDYHGKNKLIEIGDTGLGSLPVMPRGLERFLEDVRM